MDPLRIYLLGFRSPPLREYPRSRPRVFAHVAGNHSGGHVLGSHPEGHLGEKRVKKDAGSLGGKDPVGKNHPGSPFSFPLCLSARYGRFPHRLFFIPCRPFPFHRSPAMEERDRMGAGWVRQLLPSL